MWAVLKCACDLFLLWSLTGEMHSELRHSQDKEKWSVEQFWCNIQSVNASVLGCFKALCTHNSSNFRYDRWQLYMIKSYTYIHYDTYYGKQNVFYTMNVNEWPNLWEIKLLFAFYNKEMICIGPFDWNAQIFTPECDYSNIQNWMD